VDRQILTDENRAPIYKLFGGKEKYLEFPIFQEPMSAEIMRGEDGHGDFFALHLLDEKGNSHVLKCQSNADNEWNFSPPEIAKEIFGPYAPDSRVYTLKYSDGRLSLTTPLKNLLNNAPLSSYFLANEEGRKIVSDKISAQAAMTKEKEQLEAQHKEWDALKASDPKKYDATMLANVLQKLSNSAGIVGSYLKGWLDANPTIKLQIIADAVNNGQDEKAIQRLLENKLSRTRPPISDAARMYAKVIITNEQQANYVKNKISALQSRENPSFVDKAEIEKLNKALKAYQEAEIQAERRTPLSKIKIDDEKSANIFKAKITELENKGSSISDSEQIELDLISAALADYELRKPRSNG